MTDSPLVSVIIPTFNRPEGLFGALKSVLKQTFQAYEVIVVNDCGIDVSKFIKTFKDDRIFYIRHEKNKGLAATRNTGIKAARGKYIAYLDDDDIYYPTHLRTLVHVLENSEYKVAYTDGDRCLYYEKDGALVLARKFVEYSSDFDPVRFLFQNYIPVLCVMHERSCLDQVGCFDESMGVHEDWDLWARLSQVFPFTHVKKTTCAYNMVFNVQKNMTTTKGIDFLKTTQQIYRKHVVYANAIPGLTDIQKKFLINLIRSILQIDSKVAIFIDDCYDIFIDDELIVL